MTKEEFIKDEELNEVTGGTDHQIKGKNPIGKLIVSKDNLYFRYKPDISSHT